ncbi:peptide deformylase [Rhodospirillaceae bacterium KN72]|uniref:Peptide deformylase n=1 Tax=Pacificispira spongiicola TaxID=2729598 RepID=A0A7Y0HEP6_9PROT|nr:peptide deformylase [Pacificispira spongiicola]NMM43793.1 peptide deformylase [Pacificispira spongiicola]
MAILKIARMGHPVLRTIADPVDDPTDPAFLEFLDDMVETMDDADGTGLAAPQVHVPLRAVVYFVSAARGGENVPLTALINPVIEPLTDEVAYDWEGCLSVPGMLGLVPRPTRIRLTAVGADGETIDKEVTGFHARVLQHECDHLDGILYPQRMDDLSLLIFRDELRHGMPARARELMGLPPETEDEEELDDAENEI